MAEHEANELRQLMEKDLRELTLLLAGIGDVAASQRPRPDAWSVKEQLALLSEHIRARFNGLGETLRDPAHVRAPSPAVAPEKLHAIVVTCGTATALVARCRGDFEDLANLLAATPSARLQLSIALSPDNRDAKMNVLAWVQAVCGDEFKECLEQIRAVRDRAKA